MFDEDWKIRAYWGWGFLNILIWTVFIFLNQLEDFPTKKAIVIPIVFSIIFTYLIFWHFVTRPVIKGNELSYGKLFLGLIPRFVSIQSNDVVSIVAHVLIDTSDSVHIKKSEQKELQHYAEQKIKKLNTDKVLSKIHDSSLPIPGHSESFVYCVEYIKIEDRQGNKHKVKIKEKEIAKKVDAWLKPGTRILLDTKTEFSSSNTGMATD